jgi:hypothetical protein
MEAVTIKGTVYKILPQKQVNDNFTTQEIVIMVKETYRNGQTKDHFIPIQFSNQRCDEIQKVAEGQEVEVKFNLSGNEWQGKFFLKASGWTINATSTVGSPSPQPQKSNWPNNQNLGTAPQNNPTVISQSSDDSDTLPF